MYAYIDPGTGSMLFTILIGLVTASVFGLKSLFIKLSFLLRGGRVDRKNLESSNHQYVIFSDSKRYWNVFGPICDEFERRGIHAEYWTMSPDDPALDKQYKNVSCVFIGEGNNAFAKLNMMMADICLSTTPGLNVYQWKRSKNVRCYVHITHDVCAITAYRMFGVDFYDAILLPSEVTIPELRELESIRGIPKKEVTVVGSVYMDGLAKQYEKYLATKPQRSERITVLVAPSWGKSSILNRFGEKLLKVLVDTGFDVIVRPHPQSFISDPELMESLMLKYPEGEHLSWNRDNDNFAVMAKSDILISDFSGIIFDFAFTFGRSVFYADTDLDLSPYDDYWLPSEPWRLRILPHLGRRLEENQFSNLGKLIPNMLSDKSYEKEREQIKNEAWSFRTEAAKHVVDWLVQRHTVFEKRIEE